MASLHDYEVYVVKPGRTVDAKDSAVRDVMSVGLAQLSHGKGTNPIADFNQQFNKLHEQRKLTPIDNLEDLDPDIFLASGTSESREPTAEQGVSIDPNTTQDRGISPTPLSGSSASGEEDPELEELLLTSPTLLMQDEDDVALDMDDWELDEPQSDDEDMEGDSEEEDRGDKAVFED